MENDEDIMNEILEESIEDLDNMDNEIEKEEKVLKENFPNGYEKLNINPIQIKIKCDCRSRTGFLYAGYCDRLNCNKKIYLAKCYMCGKTHLLISGN